MRRPDWRAAVWDRGALESGDGWFAVYEHVSGASIFTES